MKAKIVTYITMFITIATAFVARTPMEDPASLVHNYHGGFPLIYFQYRYDMSNGSSFSVLHVLHDLKEFTFNGHVHVLGFLVNYGIIYLLVKHSYQFLEGLIKKYHS